MSKRTNIVKLDKMKLEQLLRDNEVLKSDFSQLGKLVEEQQQTIAMLSQQLADKKETIRRLIT